MKNTKSLYPYWITTPEDLAAIEAGLVRGQVHHLCKSAGGRDIPYVTYGEKPDYNRKANYSSACGAKDPAHYADRAGKRTTIMLIGATHGQETEGVCGIANLLSLLETGKDLRGEAVPMITEAFDALDPRLVIVPIYNMDGRCRCEPDSMIGEPHDDGGLRYWGQGTWKDGSLCGWPECKAVHPIKDAAGFLGSYYNDDGINLMHDNFFAPMAEETRALMKLIDEEAPECVIGLHGGSNSTNVLLQPDYVPQYTKEAVHTLSESIAALESNFGYKSAVLNVSDKNPGFPPPSFNLTTAIHHICGAVTSTYESNEGLDHPNRFEPEEILVRHYCLFAALFSRGWEMN
ncbi:MAG: hypothetical protein IJ449_09650 [Clostridia bacterium]|nr:hypothetical protein [Clostridia bacterium]